MKPLVWMIAIAFTAAACGSKQEQPSSPPASGSAASPAGSAEAPASGSANPASCAAEGGKCISQQTAISCGTKSHDGGCPDPSASYCCIP